MIALPCYIYFTFRKKIIYLYIYTLNLYILVKPCTTGDIRLYGGTYYYGAVQVCIGGVWGSICSDSFWDNNDASVVCKQLGFSPYGMYYNAWS